ncbi:MAG: DNA gyrase subunit A [Lachnospiraceae bacterium]|nr:DNA gyrase subunit A [Lachnospiraceae bacterium]
MEPTVFDKIKNVELKETMEQSYIDYAMSVITSRAIPDARDGLKPVQRRVLFAMQELKNTPDQPYRKCARIVGDTMGKYHPHGDSSIYGSLVYMAQNWNERYTLVDGHGNFGSVDGDGAAAMRYTEARLSRISMEVLSDINKDTVDFVPNFDATEKEPVVLPGRVPNLLINGAQGIAVGMATNIPPHNLREIAAAVDKIIDNQVYENRETTLEEIMSIVKGPDFPTGASILGRSGIAEAYRTGRGRLRVRSHFTIEPMENGKNRILVTEIPYLVNKKLLIGKIAELHKDKRVDGMTDVRDETNDREGTRIVIELRRDVDPNVVMNQLLRHTDLEATYGVNMLALVDGAPKLLSILDALNVYIKHQKEVVTRRTRFDLATAEARAHIIEGLLVAFDHIDEIVRMIRAAESVDAAKKALMERFELSEKQADAIVNMRLRALTGLDRQKLQDEYKDLEQKIAAWREILADEGKLLMVIRGELDQIAERYGDDRRTTIENTEDEILDEDLIPDEDCVIAMSKKGYIKRMPLDSFRKQNRGGVGIKGMELLDDDYTTELKMTGTKDNILFFTNLGRVYMKKVYEIPEYGRTNRGRPIVNLIPIQQPVERVTAVVTSNALNQNGYILMATKDGTVKRTEASEYKNLRKNGLIAITLKEGDELIRVKEAEGDEDVLMVTKNGFTIRYEQADIRTSGRATVGVRGIRLQEGDELVSMEIVEPERTVLFISENGFGKRTAFDEFHCQTRGGQGSRGYKITEKTGNLVGTESVTSEEELLLITTSGTILRTHISSIPVLGRSTVGVTVIKIARDTENRVASFAAVPEDEEEEESADGNPEGEESADGNPEGEESASGETPAEGEDSGDGEILAEGEEALKEGEGASEETPSSDLEKLNEKNDIARLLERAEADQEEQSSEEN